MENIGVSIVCNTYNQENYIAKALDSFLMQKVDFKYEILVHDDASTDGTANIIREYEKKYPDIIKPIYQEVNQYDEIKGISTRFQFPRAKGKYIAFCEGDDYWTDPLKLQKQYDYLEAHPEVDICTHGAVAIDAETEKIRYKIAPSKKSRIMPMEEVIWGDGVYVVSNSMVFRTEITHEIPEFWKQFGYQFCAKLRASIKGGMYYISDIMSVYRTMSKGSWSSKMKKDSNRWYKFNERKSNMFRMFDEYTNFKYTKIINKKIKYDNVILLINTGKYKEAFAKENRKYFRLLPWKTRVYCFLKAYMPWCFKLMKKKG